MFCGTPCSTPHHTRHGSLAFAPPANGGTATQREGARHDVCDCRPWVWIPNTASLFLEAAPGDMVDLGDVIVRGVHSAVFGLLKE